MNKLTKYFIPFFALISLASCETTFETYVGSTSIETDSYIQVKYIKFNGVSKYRIDVREAKHSLDLLVEITTSSGHISYEILLSNGTSLYTYTTSENYNNYYTLPSFGNYVIQVTGNNHKGSYKFSWEKGEN